ncbi:iron complex transport system permease protein [Tumebacillus sp. BK434]|uniref:FecCD family ABC transporter permease n=1 Tax=Tumebacillus sp. BK434 TaxID=2512169 RepID=UPI001043D283|nr:iron ABC transporter permease [Tumebacillus sp. BK434]TCP55777.1 iron complex transport system permease protein [Tumebacillus sp. BK434]
MFVLLPKPLGKVAGLIGLIALIICLMFISIVFGVMDTSWQTAVDAYTNFSGTNEQIVIKEVRVPRALIAVAVGASLGMVGVLMQTLTRNPLADPGIFGINAGASFFIVLAITFFSVNSLSQFAWIAFLGAAVSGIVVYVLGALGRDGLTPLKLTLAGAAMTALFSSMMHGMLVVNERALEEVLFWLAGSVAGRKLEFLTSVLPYLGVGWIGTLLISGQLNTLMMGDDVAKGLGQRTALLKGVTGLLIILLAGASVAVAGPIGFVGLVIPHIARFMVGIDLRWALVYSAALGAVLVLAADVAARWIVMPDELPLGVMTALIGVPFFVYVARKGLTRK